VLRHPAARKDTYMVQVHLTPKIKNREFLSCPLPPSQLQCPAATIIHAWRPFRQVCSYSSSRAQSPFDRGTTKGGNDSSPISSGATFVGEMGLVDEGPNRSRIAAPGSAQERMRSRPKSVTANSRIEAMAEPRSAYAARSANAESCATTRAKVGGTWPFSL